MLTREAYERLRRDLEQSPAAFAYSSRHWTGSVLAQHLARRYGASYTVRHCRRLLSRLGGRRSEPSRASPALEGIQSARPAPLVPHSTAGWRGFSDLHRSERVLRLIRRLASAQAPMAPFVWSVFDLLGEAIDFKDAPAA